MYCLVTWLAGLLLTTCVGRHGPSYYAWGCQRHVVVLLRSPCYNDRDTSWLKLLAFDCRSYKLQLKDASGRMWDFVIKSWANGTEHRRVYVLEQAAEYLRTFKLSMGDAVGICTNQEVSSKQGCSTPSDVCPGEECGLVICIEIGLYPHLCTSSLQSCEGRAPSCSCASAYCARLPGTC